MRTVALPEPSQLELFNPTGQAPVLVLCDHAGRHVPGGLDWLGISEEALVRHIGWDIGAAAGVPVELSDRELDQVEEALAGFGDAVRSEGVCGPAVEVGPDASRQERVIAFTGRDPRA